MASNAHLASRDVVGRVERGRLQRHRLHALHVARQSRILRSGHRSIASAQNRFFRSPFGLIRYIVTSHVFDKKPEFSR